MPAFPATGRSALRRGRVSRPGQVYLVTVTTRHRQPTFMDHARARLASQLIHARGTWGDAGLLAWVLMPDHWHGLLELGEEPLDRVVARFKAAVARELHASRLFEGKLWDRSFHDRALRREESLLGVARYIVGNPVRAGLAHSVLAYPYWNAVWLDQRAPPL
ncbi:REP-associated tyrosine transposase [Dyella sp.]|uniref:REP-associated tyrosine transposase n=1 Tax=Dyella sp. TaxID=1869338 RepID=UPI003F81B6B7